MQNAPTPGLMYPKNGVLYLLAESQRKDTQIIDLINACVDKDIQIAHLMEELAKLKPPAEDLPEGVVKLPMTPAPA
jgi:hypothetical protein